jgi:competence protein ComGC
MSKKDKLSPTAGYTLVYLLVIIFVFSTMLMPIISLLSTKLKVINSTVTKEEALQIAEAGVNYYQWHLAHFPTDYQDGTATSGPYVHDYLDKDTQEIIGQFSLEITPPSVGSTIVKIKSTGWTTDNPIIRRTVTARYGIPSLAKYSFISNAVAWIGDTESVTGELQTNNGLRFDGLANAPVKSTKTTYTCTVSQGSNCPAIKDGIWGTATQEVKNLWQFPVPTIDFSSLTSDLAMMKSLAEGAGIYLPPSNTNGYSLVFNSNGTVSVYKVTSLLNNPTGWDVNYVAHNENIDYNNRTLQFTRDIPENGMIYIEDKTWVEGVVRGRVMVAVATLPYNVTTAPSIYIPNNLVYSAKDGSDALGLLAQKDLVVTYHAPNNLEINGALIAQNGSTQFFYYAGNVKDTITTYGAIMTYGQWTWSWVNGGGHIVSGYTNTSSIYDGNFLFGPPPSFPLSASGYEQLDWISD